MTLGLQEEIPAVEVGANLRPAGRWAAFISITHSGLRQTRDASCPIHVMIIEVRYTRAEQERHDQRYRALVKSIGLGNTGDVE